MGSTVISLYFNFPTLYFPYTLISLFFDFPTLFSKVTIVLGPYKAINKIQN